MNHKIRTGLLAATIAACCAAPSAFAADAPAVVAEPGAPNGSMISSERLIVTYKDPTLRRDLKLAAVNAATRRAHAGQMAAATLGAATAAPTVTVMRQLGTGAELLRLSQRLSAQEMHAIVAEASADPSIASIQLDRVMTHTGLVGPQLVPNDPYYGTYQWHLKNTAGGANVEPARDMASGAGVVVAVLDTGITAHPDLDPNIITGYDFITDPFVSRRADGSRVAGGADLGDWAAADECGAGRPATNSSWHGTHVAGTIAELSNNGTGMAGIAPGAKVMPVRVLGRCGGYTSDIVDAITWASGGTVAGVPSLARPAEVINMSLGGSGSCDAATQTAIDGAVSRGTLVVVAAGNSNGDVANFSPASCNNVVSVGAARVTGARASYSNYGPLIDLSAPGGGGGVDGNNGYVWQSINTGAQSPGGASYGGMAGTSMASPHVAAVAALVQSVAPTPLTPAALEALLKQSVRAFPAAPDQPVGAGLLDASQAVTLALAPPGQEPATPLTNKLAVTGVSGASGTTRLYSIVVPSGARLLNLMTYGGTGDVSLYSSRDVTPTTSAAQWMSVRPGNNETIRIASPAAGTYYLLVSGETKYSGLSVTARID
ncbi:S8 family peptidase [Cognatilysobacter lacus]|nr:S8 family peptidase [Lysobacter lacus]